MNTVRSNPSSTAMYFKDRKMASAIAIFSSNPILPEVTPLNDIVKDCSMRITISVGSFVGLVEGCADGCADGCPVGWFVGCVGTLDGWLEGCVEG